VAVEIPLRKEKTMSKQLREARAVAHKASLERLAANDKAGYDKAMTEVDRLTSEIRSAESKGRVTPQEVTAADPNHSTAFAFAKYLRGEITNQGFREQVKVEKRDVSEGNQLSHIGSYSSLGFLVPTGFANKIEQATKYFAPLLDVFGSMNTASGNVLPYPISNDTAQAATIVAENGTVSEQDLTASHIIFGAYKLSAGVVKASIELMQDSAFDLEQWLADRFGERYGRGLETFLTTGTGSSQPTGLLTAIAASGATPIIAQGSSESTGGAQTGGNSVGYSDLVNLEHSVDPSYRRNARYMFHDQTLAAVKKIIDKFGRPLWTPGISVGEPDTINGYQYVINQAMPQIAVSNVTVAFGDLSKYLVRQVSGWHVQRLEELYAVNGQVGFISNMRVDGNLLDAGTHPVNVLQMHS
jgi:HK97 family phage major capsid protein